ncbi:ankyrin repeat domain-containing protein [Rhizobium sp. SSA_523]|uniref:ankyrin repeat domain-containing protein n=1 Tax=Rhizobium sp. SSA_523 TaxID=2952477 RepID=UPI002091AA74|nr:ankyrin repeat domain-containing protein [Rhizobium sp. SSA_523]MCO5731277.1 ankyrin repeat domain-containing protein [Rhizobium sp. SSA_523]WKC22187.1 ankyrin repeat domain-containing protein [Rhizobium sp. SSA_523]
MRRFLLAALAALGLSFGPAAASDAAAVAAFHDAVQSGNLDLARSMLAADSSLATSVGAYGFQPVHLLDMYFDANLLDLLLAAGADINARNDEGVTLLHIVTDPDAVPLLVQRGADLEARDARGWTPLIMQANNQQNGPDVVAALMASGANPDARGADGETALSFARETGDVDFIAVLTEGGAKK